MAVILNAQGMIFRPHAYEYETDFERDVVDLADQIFGPSSIYLDIKKRVGNKKSGNGIVTIPDGYLIDVTEPNQPKLFVVENEISSHSLFKHIGIQMLTFVTSFEEDQHTVRAFLMEGIRKNEKLLKRLEVACKKSSSPNIDHYLERAVCADFNGLIVIDEASPELDRVLEKINAEFTVLELKAFISDNGERMFQYDTLSDEFEDIEESKSASKPKYKSLAERQARRARRAISDTVVVPARPEGFQDVFMGENQWHAIRIGTAMKDRIKYIAVYRVSPISAITHLAKVKEIKPYKDTEKYQLIFDGPPEEIRPVKLKEGKGGPQAPFYVQRQKLLTAETIDDLLV